ncbi:hypothetical protein [Providencia stuartii]|uniref:Uncharacterized protein n=1 Tax=Providencia stuartii TaxID=588 RepID=A0A1S1HTR0_PROST|nr:hypothetical protein [Providencia stuartii]OHT25232.1 hypothetical protein A3Q29_15070 [Providencia stuartii]
MANRTKINLLIRLITLTTGLVIGGEVSASVIEVNAKTSPVIGHAPVVNDVTFDKTTPAVNDTVTATPTMTDADNDTLDVPLYQWQLDGKDISGATQNSYTLVAGDNNKRQLTVVVTPQTNPTITEPAIGTAFTSSPLITKGLVPEALDVKIDGIPIIGEVLRGSYRYHYGDNSSDKENTSIGGTSYEWSCSRGGSKHTLTKSIAYIIKKADLGCAITFNVTPHATDLSIGKQAQSNVVDIAEVGVRLFNGDQIGEHSGSGYNIEIDYKHLGYGTPTSITIREYDYSGGYTKKTYNIGDLTSSKSIVTDNGSTIKFGQKLISGNLITGNSLYCMVIVNFSSGKIASGSSADLRVQAVNRHH